MPGRRHRNEFGQALDDTEDERLEKVEYHNGLRGQVAGKALGLPVSASDERAVKCAFPASLTPGQRGIANIAQVAPGRPLFSGSGAT
jgi:hypothetical protein